MADAVTTNEIFESPKQIIVHLTNLSDATGETNVVKVDKSAIDVASDGAEAASLDIEWIDWNIQGFTYVKLSWNHTTDDVAMLLNGSGFKDFRAKGELLGYTQTNGLKDPRSAGTTGDILLTTAGTTSGNTYDITICLRKAAD